MLIRMGFFENFKGSDVILLDGDSLAILKLAELLRGLEGRHSVVLPIHELQFVAAYQGVQLIAHPVSKERGVRRSHPQNPCFTWEHSEEGWLEASEKIEQLAHSAHGHQWLGSVGTADATVFVSLNEYGDQLWSQHAMLAGRD